MFVSMYESVCRCTCVNGSQYLKWVKASNFFFTLADNKNKLSNEPISSAVFVP